MLGMAKKKAKALSFFWVNFVNSSNCSYGISCQKKDMLIFITPPSVKNNYPKSQPHAKSRVEIITLSLWSHRHLKSSMIYN